MLTSSDRKEDTLAETFERTPETGGRYEPLGAAELLDHDARSLRLRAGSTIVEVSVLAEDIFRVGAFPEGRPPRYDSEAIARQDWEPVEVSMERSDGKLTLSTSAATAHISLAPLRFSFTDDSGRAFAADDEELGMGFVRRPGADVFTQPLGPSPQLYKKRAEGERYFGCGERTSGLEKTGSYQIFWNVDPPLGHTASFNNLYTSIPFTLSLANGRAYGLFFDNTHRVEFDLALENEGRAYYGAEGGDLVYYVFCGPTPAEVLTSYTELTGRTPMPPLWSLGNQQCRYSYMDEDEVREVARGFRERDIPCDVIYLDIHYMDDYRVFTWNEERFPEPEKLTSDLREQGFRVVTIVDRGVAGIWCDMNEPSLFVPRNSTMPGHVVHPGGPGGEARLHAQVHNAYGSLMARAVREGLLELRPEERPFVITRAGYAGLQRHALQWTGDNSSWWEHLWMSMPQLQNLGLCGVAWAGVDVGGFWGDANGELLARFTEFGAFQPFCRNHTAIGTRRQEPWALGEPFESVCRKMLKLRQRLIPYLYSLFEMGHSTGFPILRPLLFEYPEDETTYTADDEFLLGDALLVAPITRPGIEHRHVYLPEGTWFHYYRGERFEGPTHILAHAPLGEPALYVKGNSPIPMGPDAAHTGERSDDPLTLLVYPAHGQGESTLYEDAGNGFGYQGGEYARRRISCESSDDRLTISLGERQGSFIPERQEIRLKVRGITTAQGVTINDEEHAPDRVEGGALTVVLGEEAAPTKVEVIL